MIGARRGNSGEGTLASPSGTSPNPAAPTPTRIRSRRPDEKGVEVAIAYVQEFEIKDGDTSTTNYDAINAALNLQGAPEGLLIHTAGFDLDAGVFRIFDVWETRE